MKAVFDNIGLTIQEILTIILPGLLFCFFLSKLSIFAEFENFLIVNNTNWTSGIVTFGLAYFFGYVAYVISSSLDGVYDKIKLWALRKEVKEASAKDDSTIDYIDPIYKGIFLRFLYFRDTHNFIVKVARLKEKQDSLLFEYPSPLAVAINEELIGEEKKMYNHMNAYQYAFRRLMLEENPLMFEEVIRYYATAKFFRSMTVVLFIGGFIWLASHEDNGPIPLIFLMSVLSFLVFLNRWRKANHVAYKNLIVLFSEKKV